MAHNESIADLSTKPEEYYVQTRSEMLEFIPDGAKRILDVGCGEGLFGRQLKKQREAEVWGVELMPAIADSARPNLDRVLCGDILEQLGHLPDAYFDAVIFNDVLEHLIDPYAVLVAVRRVLVPGGVVVTSIPNIRYFRNLFNLVIRGQWRYEECGTLDKTHLRFFTKKSIREMFESLNYRIIRLEGINRTPSWRVTLMNFAMFGLLDDTRYLQFACVAQPIDTDGIADSKRHG